MHMRKASMKALASSSDIGSSTCGIMMTMPHGRGGGGGSDSATLPLPSISKNLILDAFYFFSLFISANSRMRLDPAVPLSRWPGKTGLGCYEFIRHLDLRLKHGS